MFSFIIVTIVAAQAPMKSTVVGARLGREDHRWPDLGEVLESRGRAPLLTDSSAGPQDSQAGLPAAIASAKTFWLPLAH